MEESGRFAQRDDLLLFAHLGDVLAPYGKAAVNFPGQGSNLTTLDGQPRID